MPLCKVCEEVVEQEDGFFVSEDKFEPYNGHYTNDYFICNECDEG